MRKSLIWLALCACAAAGCGDEEDDRPASFEYIAVAILRPSCGTASCHSETASIKGYEFDTVESAWEAVNGDLAVPGEPELSPLTLYMRGIGLQMPPDGPIPETDIQLVERWIAEGARNN
jgi:hypothetical protein